MNARPLYLLQSEQVRAGGGSAGAKAAALARLSRTFDVPPFFVILPTAFSPSGLRQAAREQVAAALARLGNELYAVRSSAAEEDGSLHAHAGQYVTELDVAAGDVFDAALRVWRSGSSESVLHYRAARGLPAQARAPAVIVQRMLKPHAAGVAFSVCPLTGARAVVINAVAGCADALVSGQTDGDAYRVCEAGDVRVEATDGPRVLCDNNCRAVAALARACALEAGAPQDIEWAIENDRLYLLQARPITAMGAAEIAIWDNSNIVESYPGVVSPLTYSFARHIYAHVYRAFARLMGVSRRSIAMNARTFDEMLGRIDGRIYYNLLNWYRVLALFPGFKSNRAFMEQMMGVGEALPQEIAHAIAPPAAGLRTRSLDRLRMVRVGAGLAWHALVLPRTAAAFRGRLETALRTPDRAIDAMSAHELAREYRRIERLLLTRWDAPLINDFLCMIAFGASRRALEKWGGAEGSALHSDVMIGQGDIVSAEPAQRIRAMGALAREAGVASRLAATEADAIGASKDLSTAFDAYIARFGDRCVQELKLESHSLHEDAAPLLRAIAAAAQSDRLAPQRAEANIGARLASLMPGKPLKRAVAHVLLAWAKARVRDRENLRYERTRLFGRARRLFNAMGARLAEAGVLRQPRDIFYLTVEEALGAVESGAQPGLAEIAEGRRREDACSLSRPDPRERIQSGMAARAAASQPAGDDANVRRGLACCSGLATARVRVITDPRIETLEPGEIL
ncbi:MAG: PEP/pyruvate-binding domain-containing protein, partial [Vitreimonas sp.]